MACKIKRVAEMLLAG